MEAYANHLNKIKIPEVDGHMEPMESSPLAPRLSGEFSIPQAENNAAQPVVDVVQVTHPSANEVVVERVVKHAPDSVADDYEPDVSTEEDEEVADKHGDHGQRRVSGAKKLKQKLSKALHKVFHKGEVQKIESLQSSHHASSHHAPPETGNPDDEDNKVTMHREVRSDSRDQHVQSRLESAFATEGLKAAREPSESHVTLNRFETALPVACEPQLTPAEPPICKPVDLGRLMDLQDHREPARFPLTSGGADAESASHEVREVARNSPEKLPYSVRRAELERDPVLADLSDEHFNPLRRGSADRKHIPIHSSPEAVHFDNVEVRSHVGGEGHMTRSSEMWNLPAKTDAQEQRQHRSPMQELEKEGEKFSANFAKMGEHHGHGDAYEDRLQMARDKWVAPVLTAAIPADKSVSSFPTELQSTVPMRSFERVESDTDILKEGHGTIAETVRLPQSAMQEYSNRSPMDNVNPTTGHFHLRSVEKVLHSSNLAGDVLQKGDTVLPDVMGSKFESVYGLDKEDYSNQRENFTTPSLKQALRKEDSGSAPDETVLGPAVPLTPMKRSEKIVDTETAGADLAPDHRDYKVTSTLPRSLEQPVLEEKAIPDLPRATDHSDAPSPLEETHTEADEPRGMVSSVVETVESAVFGVIDSVSHMFHREPKETPEEPAPAVDPDHPERTGFVNTVIDKVWDVFTAGTEVPEAPVVEEKAEEVVVEPLVMSGEFISAPLKVPESGLLGGQQRRQTRSREI